MTVNNLIAFGTNLGNISSKLQYDEGMAFKLSELLINIAVIAVLAVLMVLIIDKWKKVVSLTMKVGLHHIWMKKNV